MNLYRHSVAICILICNICFQQYYGHFLQECLPVKLQVYYILYPHSENSLSFLCTTGQLLKTLSYFRKYNVKPDNVMRVLFHTWTKKMVFFLLLSFSVDVLLKEKRHYWIFVSGFLLHHACMGTTDLDS